MRFATCLLAVVMVLGVATGAMADKEKPFVEPVQISTRALDCSTAIPINCGDTVTANSVGFPQNVSLYNCVGWNEAGPEVVYVITLPAGFFHKVTCTLSGMTADLDVFFLSECSENACIKYGDSTFTTDWIAAGTYYIVVDGYGATNIGGPYTLAVTCQEQLPPCCPTPAVCYNVDFNEGPNGWYPMPCLTGVPVWEWGVPGASTPPVPALACDDVPVTNVLATKLVGNYPANGGEIAVIGPFDITADCWCMDLCHFHDFENAYDGGNVKVSTDGGTTWTLITPANGYDGTLNTSNPCIKSEPAFTGHFHNAAFRRDCFDLTAYVGSSILIGFFHGNDSSVHYPGWYIKWVKIGGYASPVESRTWGNIKSMYR